jgi:hypothetical protein
MDDLAGYAVCARGGEYNTGTIDIDYMESCALIFLIETSNSEISLLRRTLTTMHPSWDSNPCPPEICQEHVTMSEK